MYDLIDRPVTSLGATDRFLLDAMRAWVHALTLAGEPASAVAGGFAARGYEDGRDAFDAVMRALDQGSTDTLTFQRPCHSTVDETEAVVLGLWRLALADRLPAATAAARMLVEARFAPAVVGAMARVGATLRLD